MSNISVANSTYTTGGIDTRATLDGTSQATFQQMNGAASGVIAIETVLGDGPTLRGNKATLVERLAEAIDADGAIIGHTLGGHTNTVADGIVIFAETTGTPATGIGTGILLQSESQDENPSPVGRIAAYFSDVGTASEDSLIALQIRVGGAGLVSAYAFAATTLETAVFTHANTAQRVYTLPNESTTVVGHNATQTLTNKTIDSASNTISIRTGGLVTATGATSAGDPGVGTPVNIAMNDYSFYPATFASDSGLYDMQTYPGTDPSNTVGRFSIIGTGGGATLGARWRYVTSSDMPELWIAYNVGTGVIQGVWASDDPPGGGALGISIPGYTSLRLTAQDLEHITVLSTKASEAESYIRDRKLRVQHQAYRALQLLTGDSAPAQWVRENCIYTGSKLDVRK